MRAQTHTARRIIAGFGLLQGLLGLRVLLRFLRTARGERIEPVSAPIAEAGRVSVIVPVLNERDRLSPCLDGLKAQGCEVAEILVVDGGSCDGTQDIVRSYAACDSRIRLIDAGPTPPGWNGKVWNLHRGLEQACSAVPWVLMIDADVRPAPLLVRSLLAHARRTGLAALSAATRQQVEGWAEGMLHPAMLATLIYRFGLPGHATRRADALQANGQCFLARSDVLLECEALTAARSSRCEDMTIARCLARQGWRVGFYEAGNLVWVRMYEGWRDTWRNWPRSLPVRDRFWRHGSSVGLAEVTVVQALPPLILALLYIPRVRYLVPRSVLAANAVLAIARLGVLAGARRAYRRVPLTYWLSPLCDIPVAVQLWISLLRRRHVWRERVLVEE